MLLLFPAYKVQNSTGCNCIVHGGEPYKHPKHSHTVHDKRHARLLNLHKSIVIEAKTVRSKGPLMCLVDCVQLYRTVYHSITYVAAVI